MAEGSLVVHDKNPAMHKSDTVDIEIVISGKVDIVLESVETRTLVPGSCLIMGGVMHAWKNHYDEPCVFAIVGAGWRTRAGAHLAGVEFRLMEA